MWLLSAAKKPVVNAKPAKGDKGAKAEKAGAAAKAAPAKAEPAKPSFAERFTAWWHGYELQTHASAPTDAAPKRPRTRSRPEPEPEDAGPSDTPADAHLRIAQMVWSPGFLWPGGPELALELAKPLGLNASSTLIEIGSGLGGAARAIAQALGTYVTGFDLDPEVAAEAMIQAEVHSLEEKAKVVPFDPKTPNLRKDFFRAALIREVLYRIEDKRTLLHDVVAGIKTNQPIVIFDLFAGGAGPPGKTLAEWTALEPHPIHLCRLDELKAILTERQVEIRVEQDDSEFYCGTALRAWSEFVERLGNAAMTKDLVIPLVREVELWTRRIAALQSGDLKIWRVVGIKRAPLK
jgi:hypothetical protein